MPTLANCYRVVLIVLLIFAGLLLSMYWAGWLAEQRTWAERSQEARGQLDLYAQTIHTQVERFRSVPALLALDSDIRKLLENPGDRQLRNQLNRRLERQNQAAGSSVLYLIDRQGNTLAASNWREWSSFVGYNYGFRPYFRDALTQDSGRYFAVGVTTGIPGYFLSSSVKNAAGEVLGVLVVKLELEDMQREWVGQSGILLITDALDIVILSNRPAWRFRYLQPLSDETRSQLVAARRYAEQNLQPLHSRRLQRIDEDSERRQVDGPDGRHNYFWQRLTLPSENWTLHLLQEPQLVAANIRSYRLAAAGVWMTLAFLLLYLAQRRKTRRVEQRSRQELERLVEARTRELRTAQDGLVHAARMAALGQMSAALAHEINQPLSVIQMTLANLVKRVESGQVPSDLLLEKLDRISSQVVRAAGIVKHVRVFGRWSGVDGVLFSPSQAVEGALSLMGQKLELSGVNLVQDGLEELPTVKGQPDRLEQVLVNLMANALHAMMERKQKVPEMIPTLTICAEIIAGQVCLTIEDNGGGIPPAILGKVFEPFFTTKSLDQGTGLGLSVSREIISQMSGRLLAENSEKGACMIIELPVADAEEANEESAEAPVLMQSGLNQ